MEKPLLLLMNHSNMEDSRPVKINASTLIPIGVVVSSLIVFAAIIMAFTNLQNKVSEQERRIGLLEETQISVASDARRVDERLARIETTLQIILDQLKKQ